MITGPEIARRLGGQWHGQSGVFACPVCQPERRPDQKALSVSIRNSRILFKCHKSSCAFADIMRAAGIDREESSASAAPPTLEYLRQQRGEDLHRAAKAARAARLAAKIMSRATPTAGHPYMVRKGFARHPVPCIQLSVLDEIMHRPKMFRDLDPSESVLCIGLYDAITSRLIPSKRTLKSIQMIAQDGSKYFLYGASTKGVAAVIENDSAFKSVRIVCEGYATGLSARYAAQHEGIPNIEIVCCMLAGNMGIVAQMAECHGVLADHDASKTGEKAARGTGLPFLMPPVEGEDFNDFWKQDPLNARRLVGRLYFMARRNMGGNCGALER